MTAALVLEVGPALVRALGPTAGPDPHPGLAEAALDGLDEPVVLLGERPVAVDRLWATLLAGLVAGGAGPVLLVCPSWWPRSRIQRVRAACAGNPLVLTRATAVARRRGPGVVLVELATGLAAVSAAGSTGVLSGWDPARIAGAALAAGREVLLDAPPGVAGAPEAAAAIREALRAEGVHAVAVDPAELAVELAAGSGRPRALRTAALRTAALRTAARRPALLAGAGVLVGALVVGVLPSGPLSPAERSASESAPSPRLVEGRVAVVIPRDWPVTRVTDGPGSPRVQVDSPGDPDAALHITQSHTPGSGLVEAADVLGRAVATARPAGVFVDFRADGDAGGRPAVTYRELRPGRIIDWSVLQDGATRIGIGCQSAPQRAESIRAACRDALRSARELIPPRRPG